MPTLNINGQKVKVDDSFLKLSPEQQGIEVDHIAKSLGAKAAPKSGGGFWNSASDFFKSIGSGIGQGLADTASAEGRAQESLETGGAGFSRGSAVSGGQPRTLSDLVTGRNAPGLTVPDSEESRKIAGVGYEPQGALGRTVQSVGRAFGTPSSYMMPGGPLAKAAGIAGGAIGAQAGAEAFPNSAVAPVIGGMLGGAASGSPVRRLEGRLGPKPSAARLPDTDPVHKAYVNTLEQFGVDRLSAGDFTGKHGTRKVEQVGGLLGGGGKYEANKITAEKQLTTAALNLMGEQGERVMPATLGMPGTEKQSADRIGQMFDRAEKMFRLNHEQSFVDGMHRIMNQAAREKIGKEELARLGAIVRRFRTNDPDTIWGPISKSNPKLVMKGDAYKSFTAYDSALSRAIRKGGDLGYYAQKIDDLLTQQMDRSARGPNQKAGVALLREARKQWYTRGVILDSVTDSKEAGRKGLIDPDKLARNARGAASSTQLSQLAEAAGNVMTEPKPGSIFASSHETGQGLIRHGAQAGAAGVGAAIGFGLGGIPGAAVGLTAPGLLGRAVNTRLGQRFLKNAPGPRTLGARAATGARTLGGGAAIGAQQRRDEKKRPRLYE